jgi:L-asparaginase II
VPELAVLAEVIRSGFVESVHYGSAVGLDPSGLAEVALGRVDAPVLPRSSAKPFQALACLTANAGARALTGPRLAIAAGSHTGEDFHVRLVRELLADHGLDAGALRCPPSWPEDRATMEELIRQGSGITREHMNCSGKHAAMLAACVVNGWDVPGYLSPDHPLQLRVRSVTEELAGERSAHAAVDGCGAPLFGLSLTGLARAVQALVLGAPGSGPRQVADAMRMHPEYVGGTGHQNTDLMRALPGAVVKGGAEGVLVAGLASGHSVAVKVIDGSPRATTAIALGVLRRMGCDITPAASAFEQVDVLGGGVPVGRIVTRL